MLHAMPPAAHSHTLRPAALMLRSRCAPLNPLARPHTRTLRTLLAGSLRRCWCCATRPAVPTC